MAEIGACEMLGDGCKVLLADDSAIPHYFEAEAKTVAAPSERARSNLQDFGPDVRFC